MYIYIAGCKIRGFDEKSTLRNFMFENGRNLKFPNNSIPLRLNLLSKIYYLNFLNYLIDKDTTILSELEPVLIESSSIYVFTRALFKKNRHRIGENPYIKEVGHFEGFEVNNKDDLTMAELMINAGLDKEF